MVLVAGLALAKLSQAAPLEPSQIPEALKPWQGWVLWGKASAACPASYADGQRSICFWPSRLSLAIEPTIGHFNLEVQVFARTWVPLPGNHDLWPLEVKPNGVPVPVMERNGVPAVDLPAGTIRLEGVFRWNEIPQSFTVPPEIGLLALTLSGLTVESPTWNSEGTLWLKREATSSETNRNFLGVKVYAALEDGIPLWWRSEIELIVSGQSREEDIGSVLPQGWKLAEVTSPIPVAVDDSGRLKAQVRAGRWKVSLSAFRLDNPTEFRFAKGAKVAVGEELVAFQANPNLRMVDIVGAPSIDVAQTSFPAQWAGSPVYRWDNATPFRMEERMRGMGLQKPEGLQITREWWLDENGKGLTFHDQISGNMQQIWRLDTAVTQDLGSVRSNDQGQLITRNPRTGAAGVEIRTRDLHLTATGRMNRAPELSATGWQADADKLNVKLNLPPGWRLFALFGADWVQGDWLTAWTLLDIFILLIFTLAVFRIWGVMPAILALLALGLSFHEEGAPRYLWLALLVPLALLRVVPPGTGRRLVDVWKWLMIVAMIFALVPFVAKQIQQALYPQMERFDEILGGVDYQSADQPNATAPNVAGIISRKVVTDALVTKEYAIPAGFFSAISAGPASNASDFRSATPPNAKEFLEEQGVVFPAGSNATFAPGGNKMIVRNTPDNINLIDSLIETSLGVGSRDQNNLAYDSKARIQTGPGVPNWSWRVVSFGWNGPVTAAQTVSPVLIPVWLERVLTVLRVALLLILAAVLLNARRSIGAFFGGRYKGVALGGLALLMWAGGIASAQAQFPDQKMLDTFRERLLEKSDAFPNAASVPSVTLNLQERKLAMDVEIHTATWCAVPLPGKLPAWAPVSIVVDGKPASALRREDGYLWVVLPEGVHHVRVDGLLSDAMEWEWTFLLKPHRVVINAPSWTYSGVKPDGAPEQQVFFAMKQKAAVGQAGYDYQDLQTAVVVDRQLELGLIWQVRTTVTRLSPEGKAVSLRIPLLPGENVLSANAIVRDGFIDVRLGAHETSYEWESELPVVTSLNLATKPDDAWVERWHLVASPIWNVGLSGLSPIFEPGNTDLVPVWQPWPGDSVELSISRPEAIAGATVTVDAANHEITLGQRQRISKLDLALRCSMGEDFLIDLPEGVEITSLKQSDQDIPVRKDGSKLIVPLHPGAQSISIGWKENIPLGFKAKADAVKLPVESANITTEITVPTNRWVLGTFGPLRGPAVQFWSVLLCSLLAALLLGRVAFSPLRMVTWLLLAIGLTQVPLMFALIVVGWLFLLEWRGGPGYQRLSPTFYNLTQFLVAVVTLSALGVLISAVGEGLLGNPEMFIQGNGSTQTLLRWYDARSSGALPEPGCFSVSIWWYRLLMLLWALWLATAIIRWLAWGWGNFSKGGCIRRGKKMITPPPPLP
jgi:hypothetical protein